MAGRLCRWAVVTLRSADGDDPRAVRFRISRRVCVYLVSTGSQLSVPIGHYGVATVAAMPAYLRSGDCCCKR